jgi:rhodanese-related sulfurtransferase
MSKKILQINFKILISPAEYKQANQPYGRVIANIPGLAWKVWLMNESNLEAGGIYLFDDEIALQAFLNGPIVGSLKENPALTDLSLKFFDVLQNLTAETRGPLSIQRGKRTFNQMSGEAFASVPVIRPDELHRWLQREPKPLVIDVQDAADVAMMGTIPGAVNISYGSLTYKADHELPDEWRDPRLADHSLLIVVTCTLGPFGALGAKLLQDMGYTNVYILEGGVQAWMEAGYPVQQPA